MAALTAALKAANAAPLAPVVVYASLCTTGSTAIRHKFVPRLKILDLACGIDTSNATHAFAAGAAEGSLGAAPRTNQPQKDFNTSPLPPRRQHRVAQAEEEDDDGARDAQAEARAALGAHALQSSHRRI